MDTIEYLSEKYGATMTPRQVAEVLHQHPAHVRALCKSGKLPAVRIGSRWHIPTEALCAILKGVA